MNEVETKIEITEVPWTVAEYDPDVVWRMAVANGRYPKATFLTSHVGMGFE